MIELDLVNTFILHQRSYRESSLLIDFFTDTHGLVRVISKGAKRQKTNSCGNLQSFNQLRISAKGRDDLLTLTHNELVETHQFPAYRQQVCALYINELLTHTLKPNIVYNQLFDHYQLALRQLSTTDPCNIESVLRVFEHHLLSELGYGFALDQTLTGESIQAEETYLFEPNGGLVRLKADALPTVDYLIKGSHLIAFANGVLCSQSKKTTKQLMQLALSPLLKNKTLTTRSLLCH